MPKQSKLKSFEALQQVNYPTHMADATIALVEKRLMENEAVGVMAQILGLEQASSKIASSKAKAEANLKNIESEIERTQRSMLTMEANFRFATTNDPSITAMRARWKEFFNSFLDEELRKAKNRDETYQESAKKLKKLIKQVESTKKLIERHAENAQALKAQHDELEAKLASLLNGGANA